MSKNTCIKFFKNVENRQQKQQNRVLCALGGSFFLPEHHSDLWRTAVGSGGML